MNTATTMWHDRPAGPDWNRAYPLGSGRLGANPREWTKEVGQRSEAIPLKAGQRYYIEARR